MPALTDFAGCGRRRAEPELNRFPRTCRVVSKTPFFRVGKDWRGVSERSEQSLSGSQSADRAQPALATVHGVIERGRQSAAGRFGKRLAEITIHSPRPLAGEGLGVRGVDSNSLLWLPCSCVGGDPDDPASQLDQGDAGRWGGLTTFSRRSLETRTGADPFGESLPREWLEAVAPQVPESQAAGRRKSALAPVRGVNERERQSAADCAGEPLPAV